MAYSRITFNERKRIKQLLNDGLSINKIAATLKRSKSSISTEVRRKCMTAKSYNPIQAQADAKFKRSTVPQKRKIKGPLESTVQLLLLERHWSPEQISNYLKINYPSQLDLHVSTEAIYKYVYSSPNRAIYTQSLRRRRKRRRKRKEGGIKRGGIKNRVSIRERDPSIENREIAGHWEGDLVVGKGNKSAIGTAVERKTRLVKLVKLSGKDSKTVVDGFMNKLSDLPNHLKLSFTYDQGTEMSQHERFTHETGIQVYFADPGSPWQRGTNENMNGLVREFFPKGTDFNLVQESELMRVEALLNKRPKKILGYDLPNNCFEKELCNGNKKTYNANDQSLVKKGAKFFFGLIKKTFQYFSKSSKSKGKEIITSGI